VSTLFHFQVLFSLTGLPPGPPPLPLIGNMRSFQWDMDKVFLEWKSRYGRIFTVWLPYPMIVIGDHKVLQEHVVKNGDIFLAKRNPEQMMDIIAGGQYGLVFEDNNIVKEQRKFAMKSLHDIGFGSAAIEDFVYDYALEIARRWKNSGEEEVDVSENIMRAVGSVIWKLTFGIDLVFDDPITMEFRALRQAIIPLLANRFMMFIELFPIVRKFEFLFGNPESKLREAVKKDHKILKEAINISKRYFNADNEPRCYIEAFLAEQKRREEAGISEGNAF
ncbi:hypothetical protein PMAYCL1PPCAC_24619, partial [Pristionchus mayeri]